MTDSDFTLNDWRRRRRRSLSYRTCRRITVDEASSR